MNGRFRRVSVPGRRPTDRGKPGTERDVLTEGGGGPVGAIVAPASQHDSTLIQGIVESVVVDHPDPTPDDPQRLCPDTGFDTEAAEAAVVEAGYEPHVRRIGEEAKPCDRSKGQKPRRWVVERTIGWLNRCRALLVWYDECGKTRRPRTTSASPNSPVPCCGGGGSASYAANPLRDSFIVF